MATPGHRLLAADYSNIEGRVLAWLAGEQWKLQAFRDYDEGTGPDLYILAVSKSFGIPLDEVDKKDRQKGKVQELASGYQGGLGAYKNMADIYGIVVVKHLDDAPKKADFVLTEDECEDLKIAWRRENSAIVSFWYALERAAIAAVKNHDTVYEVAGGKIKYCCSELCGLPYLICQLPSGRTLHYPYPTIEPGKFGNDQVHYWGLDSYTKQWRKQSSYGGHLAENVTQAVARDVLAEAYVRIEQAGYPVAFHVHDEIVAEMPNGQGAYSEFSELMAVLPDWAHGLPISVDGWEGQRYRK